MSPLAEGQTRTREEALALALDWAEGRRSYCNAMMAAEASFDARPQTLAAIAQADAAEVVKWSALAAVLPLAEPEKQTRPFCECGYPECCVNDPASLLPLSAWSVAGSDGAGRGPDGNDLLAILPDHLDPDLYDLVERHDGWLTVTLRPDQV